MTEMVGQWFQSTRDDGFNFRKDKAYIYEIPFGPRMRKTFSGL